MVLHVLKLEGVPILQQLQYEEALLRADQRNWCIINRGSPAAIVMGISAQPSLLIDRQKYESKSVPLIKRFSGGGTVFVDEETLFITFICNSGFLPISPYPEPIMRWTEELYRPLLAPLPFALRENDYIIGEKKFGGNAQSIIKNRWLHHSSLLWDYSPENMDYLLLPPKMPAYRDKRSHTDFLCTLSQFMPCPDQFQQQFLQHLKGLFNVVEKKRKDVEEILSLPHRKATTLINL